MPNTSLNTIDFIKIYLPLEPCPPDGAEGRIELEFPPEEPLPELKPDEELFCEGRLGAERKLSFERLGVGVE